MRIALVGGGPSALFVLKRLVESGRTDLAVHLYEQSDRLGCGMPYGSEGAGPEHVTNVSSNELPDMPETLQNWLKGLPERELTLHGLSSQHLVEDRVVPRLLFGQYLQAQFTILLERAPFPTRLYLQTKVEDIKDLPEHDRVEVVSVQGVAQYDRVVLCNGHYWPQSHEGKVAGYFDSPYPPQKIARVTNHAVALRGSSLTAVDAIRTLALANGTFRRNEDGDLEYHAGPASPHFEIVMHSRNGLLPCVRFHLEAPQVGDENLLQRRDWLQARQANQGFVPLDLFFEHDFKKELRRRDPWLYEKIRPLTLEQFVEAAMAPRLDRDPFDMFALEYQEAQKSMDREEAVHWKEALSILSFALNYPAKHFSAEDSLRVKEVLAPLIAVVIAFIPHSSTQQLLALRKAGRLKLVEVGQESRVEPTDRGIVYHTETSKTAYQTFVDCVGQKAMEAHHLPFPSLVEQGAVRPARLRFRDPKEGQKYAQDHPDQVEQDSDGSYHLLVPGIAINDNYQPLGADGRPNPRLAIMAVAYMSGHNPDYSGLDFCEKGSELVVDGLFGRAVAAPFSGSASAVEA